MLVAVLLAVTAHNKLGRTGAPTGCWLEELAVSCLPFEREGFEVLVEVAHDLSLRSTSTRLKEAFVVY